MLNQQDPVVLKPQFENMISSQGVSERCQDLESINERLRIDLRESLKKNFELSSELRECSSTLTSYEELKSFVASLTDEKKDLEEAKRSLRIQLDAAVADSRTMRELNETLSSERDYCNKLIDELKESNSRISTDFRTLQNEINCANSDLSTMRLENSTLQERLFSAENSLSKLESTSSIDMEVRQLRSQLSEAKRQIVEQTIKKEAEKASASSISIIEREEHSRKVYENIILELRKDLEIERKSVDSLTEQIDALKMKCSKIDELEIENNLYKEAAQKAREEANFYSASISEAYGQREKSSGDRSNAMDELGRAKCEIAALKSENTKLNELLDKERSRIKIFNSEKLRVENESADLRMSNSKLEAVIGDLRYQIRILENNLEKANISSEDQNAIITEYSDTIRKMENSQTELKEKLRESYVNVDEMKFDGRDLLLEVKSLQKLNEEYKKEIQLNRETISSQRSNLTEKSRENEKLREDIELMKIEKHNFNGYSTMHEMRLNESRLQELKKEVNATVVNLQKDEQDKIDTLSTLQIALNKEKDKSGKLLNRVNELEDRISFCVQELDMYRSLDIYRNSVQSQLKGYRSEVGDGVNASMSISRSLRAPSHVRKSAFSFRMDDQERDYSKLDIEELYNPTQSMDISSSPSMDESIVTLNRSTKLPSRKEFEMAKKLLLSL